MTPLDHRRPHRERALTLLALALILALGTVGCRHHRHHHTSITATPVSFTLDEEFKGDYEEDRFYWDTDLDQARVEFRVRHFHDGSARIRIYDGDGYKVFDEDYYSDGCDCFGGDDEYFDVSYTAPDGVSGEWVVRLEVWDFSGHLYLSID